MADVETRSKIQYQTELVIAEFDKLQSEHHNIVREIQDMVEFVKPHKELLLDLRLQEVCSHRP